MFGVPQDAVGYSVAGADAAVDIAVAGAVAGTTAGTAAAAIAGAAATAGTGRIVAAAAAAGTPATSAVGYRTGYCRLAAGIAAGICHIIREHNGTAPGTTRIASHKISS